MSDRTPDPVSETSRSASTAKNRLVTPRRIGTGLTVGGLVVALGLGGLYLGRRAVAEEVLVGWLHRRGIQADVEVQRIEWDGFTGRITVGNPDDPDVRVEKVEVDYLIGLPWSAQGMGLTPRRVLLDQPLVKAEWTGKALSFGSLDPLIEEFTARPPGPEKPGPLILVNKGRALVATPYGAVTATADARVNDKRLEWIKATLDPADLTLNDLSAKGLDLVLEATSGTDDLDFKLVSRANGLATEQVRGEGVALDLSGTVPYPRQGEAKARGPVTLTGTARIAKLDGAARGESLEADVSWQGVLDGWIDRFTLNGAGELSARADALASGEHRLGRAKLTTQNLAVALSRAQPGQADDRLHWRLEGPAQLQAANLTTGGVQATQVQLSSSRLLAGGDGQLFETQGPLTLLAGGLNTGDLKLRDVRGQLQLDAVRGLATRIALRGGLGAQGRFDGLGPVTASDAPQLARLKQAAQDFRLSVPQLSFAQTNRGNALQLGAPAQAVSSNGAVLTLETTQGPVMRLAEGGPVGAGRLTLSGEGIPDLAVDIRHWQAGNGGFSARLNADGALDFDPVSGIAVKTGGVLDIRNGVTRYRADGCADVRAASVAVGANTLSDLSGQLCAGDAPLFSMQQGQWRLSGRLVQTALDAPFAGARLSQGQGVLSVAGRGGDTTLRLQGLDAVLSDLSATAPDDKSRFNPVNATGEVRLAGGAWSGDLALARDGYRVANLRLDHNLSAETGALRLDTGPLVFAGGGLQPASLSPMLADFVGSPATGQVAVSGQFLWSPSGWTSDGQMDISDMSFATPMGQIEALNGQLVFTDLLKLTMEEDATFTARRLNAFLPAEDLELRARTRGRAVALDEVGLSIGGGRVRATSVLVPFNRHEDVTGTLHLENLQVNDLLAAANLRDKASFQAALTGTLGFRYNERLGWQIASGELTSDEGRLEISPEVLTGMSSESGELTASDGQASVELPPNAMQDLAYQALENLAIDSLTAEVQSQPGGRLGIRFVIDGRHDPDTRKELRVSLIDLIRGDFMKRRLDLPSGTPVILNLNTSWNANELATEIFNVMRRRFEDVQGNASPDGTDGTR